LAALTLLVLAALTSPASAQTSQPGLAEPVSAADAAANAHEFPRYLLQNGRGRAERDTGAVLDAYTANFDSRILGLTGSLQLVRWAADNFKVQFEKVREPGAAPNIYTMDHTAGMFLLGPDGQRITKFMYATPVKDMVATINQWLDVNEKLPKK
jgi:hypothetical protein